MLARLSIRDIVLIDALDVVLSDGLTVLTGETGAGKSILLDAFALALGGRGDGGLVRHGAQQGQITAVFDVAAGHPARLVAASAGLDAAGEDLILRRVQLADGRTRGFVNDQPVSAQILRALGAELVEIHGQHDDRAMLDAGTHRALLDAFGGLEAEALAVGALHDAMRTAEGRLRDETAAVEAARQEQAYLRHAHEELARLAVEPGEEDALARRRLAMQQAEKVAKELGEAYEAVGGPHSPVAALSMTMRRLERRRDQAPALIEPPVRALESALVALDEARLLLEASLRETAFDPAELERIEERLFALRAAGRKYSVAPDDLLKLAGRFAADLAALDAGEAGIATLTMAARAARAAFTAASDALSRQRAAAAAELDRAVNAELPPLKLERARFTTHIASDPAQASADGFDRIEFWVQTNPGTRPGPMMKVASGGELSRFMLALKVVLADRGSAPTLVFDEIDTGVGGAVADAIGQRLARLAEKVQVLSVTHAPQVAARAARHFLIAKEDLAERAGVATRVAALETPARREEIARMLSGATITDEARAAADRLIEAAG